MTRKKCRHCRRRLAERQGGLCRSCYSDKTIRALYPVPLHKHAQRGLAFKGCRVPATPTTAPPGSVEKMRVMQQRIRRGEQLFHPHDLTDVDALRLHPFAGGNDTNLDDNDDDN